MRHSPLVLFLSAVLLGSGLATTARPAAATPQRGDLLSAEVAVAPEVQEQLASASPGDTLDVIVTLREQADLPTIAATARRQRLRQVIERLHDTADSTQGPLLGRLSTLKARGLVRRFTPFWAFNGIAVTATTEAVREIAARPEVRAIAADRTIEAPTSTPSETAEPNVALVNAPALWGQGFRGEGVVVANMDTGVDAGHPDLDARWRGGTNSWFDPNGQHDTPTDVNGHGTWTMGVMVGGSSGGTAIGVAPAAQWIAVKIFDDAGVATSSDIHAGFQWLLDPDQNPATADAPQVVNNSWSMGSVGCDLDFQLDLQSLRAAGILPLFAAGNYGPGTATSASPANNPEAFAVGATDTGDGLSSESSRGPSACGEPETVFPELVAPGVDVRTTDLYGLYTQQTGTSLAAPHVAGALALLLDAFPALSADDQQEALERGALDLGPPGPDNENGHGRLDALASYNWLTARADFGVAVAPDSAGTTPGGSVGYTVTVTSVNGFTGDVTLSLGGLTSSQASWTFAPGTIAGGAGSSQLTVTTAAALAPGTYPLTVSASSGSLVHSVPVTLVVNSPADFGLAVTPARRTVYRGAWTTYRVGVSVSGDFAGTVDLSVEGLPPRAAAWFRPGSVVAPGSSTLVVKTTSRTSRGSFTLTVTGRSGSIAHQGTTTLIVK